MELKIIQPNQEIIIRNLSIANSFLSRLRGWLGKQKIFEEEALLLTPCNSVHTFGMHVPIDVLFINKRNEICFVIENMKPNRISPTIKKANRVIELKGGAICKLRIRVSDIVEILSITYN